MNFFALKENNTTVKTEILAGITTFTAMVYILVVNPAILSVSGMPAEAVLGATIFSSALMTLSMAFFTNLPVALAPGMGLNAFFTYTLCMGVGMSWQAALGLVFYSGVLFLIMTLTGLRRKLLNLIPESVRHGLTVGIGLFITLIGLKNAGIIVAHPATLITLGNVKDAQTWFILGGILLAGYFHLRRISAGLLLSILFISVCLVTLGKAPLPESFFSLPPSMGETFFKLDLAYFWQNPWQCIPLVLSLFLVDLFDNLGTLLAVCSRARLVDEKGEIRNIDRALKADAFAAMTGAFLGTSSVTSYIESAAGVEQGGRTGLTSVTVAVCFLLSLFLAPVFLSIPLAATTPALVLVGFFMISEITRVDFGKIETALPAFITMIMIPFTFSIAEGLAMGLVTYFIFRLLRKNPYFLFILISTSAFACNTGEVITTAANLKYECDKSVPGLNSGWRDPRGIVWGNIGQKDCEKFGARSPTGKELKIHNEELNVKESGDRCVKSVVHHYHKFPKTPATPFTGKEIDFYREEDAYGEFSNFSGFPVFMDGEWWSTSEHYYQAQKYETQELKDWVHYAPTPMEAANRGRDPKVPKRKDWDQVKDGFMEKVLVEKFHRHPDLKKLLLSTKNALIYEHTTNDCYWADCGNRTGKNRLGVLLMKVRESLR